ncbi:S-adenosyl-dependent methyltransferase activity on membrane-located substrates [Methylacidimicrobium sp. AP8]|uniref:16S rRNA (cytosine(1402)-N(4))-methyltransferase RsmH n=1 Tax=Methylacidimicrobium sp. AP8 TaxID=2730359 RepID=UPI0018C05478|nr:16S rRNA (cytosine(1402)-N(4))-methyltransferase RsmH [Methylacidimicrobium sp. AP8]CAB4242936.1 S-adenosyl-dependent methyltransferase activity on membrane-located substrates [Methylacidimicrobium sp. AP8]
MRELQSAKGVTDRRQHEPVLLRELLAAAEPAEGERWIDGTFGFGGHAAALLERGCVVLAIDRDPSAAPRAALLQETWRDRLRFVPGNFADMAEAARAAGWQSVDGVLLDLGISSGQLDDPSRGFSFRWDAPLDMRMDPSDPRTAVDLLHELDELDLARLFAVTTRPAESRRLARAVVRARERGRLRTTGDLVAAIGAARPSRRRVHPATRAFLALRIAVNDELGSLERALPAALRLLAPGGRLAVISFQSEEDRRVKHFLREHRQRGSGAEKISGAPGGFAREARFLPSGEEIARNPRSRSARLRIGWKERTEEL